MDKGFLQDLATSSMLGTYVAILIIMDKGFLPSNFLFLSHTTLCVAILIIMDKGFLLRIHCRNSLNVKPCRNPYYNG